MPRLLLALLLLGAAQEKKEPAKPPTPRICFAAPFVVVPGKPVHLAVRGLNLDQATEIRFAEPVEGGKLKIKSKGKVEVPKDQEASVYGDTKADVEVLLPSGTAKASLVAVNPAGETEPYVLEVVASVTAEKEPNGGFAQAQPLESGALLHGAVSQGGDVDCFRIDGKAGETWVFEVIAQRRGGPLDAMLTLHDPGGRVLVSTDDRSDTRDPVLKATLKADGPHVLVLMDAHNAGGGTHGYLLGVRRE